MDTVSNAPIMKKIVLDIGCAILVFVGILIVLLPFAQIYVVEPTMLLIVEYVPIRKIPCSSN